MKFLLVLIINVLLGFALSQDSSILDIVQDSNDLTNLVSLVLFADPSIQEVLGSPGNYTLFAPSNLSWQTLFELFDVNAATLALLDRQDGTLTTALKYHVVDGVYGSGDVIDGLEVTTLQGEALVLNLSNDTETGFIVNNVDVVTADISASNGVVHIINGVLVPKELSGEEEVVIVADTGEETTETESPEEFTNVTEADVEEGETGTIVEVAQSTEDLSDLVSLIVVANPSISEALSSSDNYTVFAPNNAAWQAVYQQFDVNAESLGMLDQSTGILTTTLTYHVVPGLYISGDIVDGIELTTVQGEDVTLQLASDSTTGFVVNGVEIVSVDVPAQNGVIHVINGVLVPKELASGEEPETSAPSSKIKSEETSDTTETEITEETSEVGNTTEIDVTVTETSNDTTVIDIAIDNSDLSILVGLVIQTDLIGPLSEPGPYTVFAPSDDAFLSAFEDVSDLSVVNDDKTISSLLQYHVVEGIYLQSSITDGLELTTLLGEIITFNTANGTIFVNQATITLADEVASNGVVHVIDAVLLPIDDLGNQTNTTASLE